MTTVPRSSIPSRSRSPVAPRLSLLTRIGLIAARTLRAFLDDNITRLGAALAFYTTIAVAPLMVLAIAAAGILFDETTARERVLAEITNLAGSPASAAIQSVQNPVATNTGLVATALSTATLIFGAFGVFQHLQNALNSIWRVETPVGKGWWWFLKRRLFSLATVLVTGFLLLVSLIASAAISWMEARMVGLVELPVALIQIANLFFSLGVVTLLFALIFRLLPDRPIPWRHVWFGAAVTAFLFTAGKTFLSMYLGRAALASAYGAAGSLVVLLLWSYYAAQIVFLGAEFTRVATLSRGGRDFSPLDEPDELHRTP
jgi:membrane protein